MKYTKEEIKKEIVWAIDNYYNSSGIVWGSCLICDKSSLDLPRINGEFTNEEITIRLIKEHTSFRLFSKNKIINSYIDIEIKKEFTFIEGTAKYKSHKCYDKKLYLKLENLFKHDLNKQKNKDELRSYDLFKSEESSK